MEARRAAAFAFSALALALGLAACGGGSSKKQKQSAVAARVARQHWRKGMMRWHHDTQNALDGLSLMFATEASLASLGSGTSHASHRLILYEGILVRCSSTVHGLGPVPAGFELAGRYALAACQNLEKGEHGVESLVVQIRHGGGFDTLDPLTGAGSQLSLGQADLTTVVHALSNAPE
jgi:hypothetical protein